MKTNNETNREKSQNQKNKSLSYKKLLIKRIFNNWSVRIGGLFLLIIILLTIFAPFITNYDPLQTSVIDSMKPPSKAHPFGTDQYGRDILSRVLYGGRISLVMGAIPIAISASIGVMLGLIVGYFGGLLDTIVMRFIDVMMAFPPMLLALAVVAILGSGLLNIMIAIGISMIPYYVRMGRGETIRVRENVYVEAVNALGAKNIRILLKHILPNVLTSLMVMMTMGIANAILIGAALSFLGLGAPPPTPEWGIILNEGKEFIGMAWWLTVFPGLAIFFTVLFSNILGDGLRDVLDPKVMN